LPKDPRTIENITRNPHSRKRAEHQFLGFSADC
jgi:hypothetical protein